MRFGSRFFASALVVGAILMAAVACAGEPSSRATPSAGPSGSSLGRHPWLGVSMEAGSEVGVPIASVVRGSPAERSGIRSGDRILALDGVAVREPAQVSSAVATHKVGDTVTLSLDRGREVLRVTVVLGARPASDDMLRMQLVGAPAPEWKKVVLLTGAPSSMASLKGRVVLLDFWASWCGPCRLLAPRLAALKDRLGPQGLALVGITTDEPEEAATFAERHQLRYPMVSDKDSETSRRYGIVSLPTLVLVDRQGIVREVFVGFDPSAEERLEAYVKRLLAEPVRSGGAPPGPPAAAPRAEGR